MNFMTEKNVPTAHELLILKALPKYMSLRALVPEIERNADLRESDDPRCKQ
jgi:hypothetical protein